MFEPAPDYVEPVVGWRIWHVAAQDGALRLCSPLFRTAWTPRQELAAACRRNPESVARRRHTSPAPGCRCGIYAGLAPAAAVAYMTRFFRHRDDVVHRVIGTVSLWGVVLECERGWRGSRAYPARIYVPSPRGTRLSIRRGVMPRPSRPLEEIARELADFGVPVEVVECSSLGELAETLSASWRAGAARAAA